MSGKHGESAYEDIINLPHHVSPIRPRMSGLNRAAQFSPFAALTGYDTALGETARLTDRRIELTETEIAGLDMKLGMLAEHAAERPEISVTFFRPDKRKEGGEYITVSGGLKKLDAYERALILTTGEEIPVTNILELESELFGDRFSLPD